MVIVPGLELVPSGAILTHSQLRAIANVPIELENEDYTAPFIREAQLSNERAGYNCQYVCLGSIATEKYTRILLEVFRDRLLFLSEFVGRGDMSRGGLMLRCARTTEELAYIAVEGALGGRRPPKLGPP